jgi:hypothetical protein
MKQYVVDEIRFEDYKKIRAWLDEKMDDCAIEGIYWLLLDDTVLNETQVSHLKCRPFYFIIELEPTRISCELLVRTRNTVRCDCMAYATDEQFFWLVRWIDHMLDALEINV